MNFEKRYVGRYVPTVRQGYAMSVPVDYIGQNQVSQNNTHLEKLTSREKGAICFQIITE